VLPRDHPASISAHLKCAKCDRALIVTVATGLVSDGRSLHARLIDALEEAREMPPGAPRTEALKKARPSP
jgi:hypothetical protein